MINTVAMKKDTLKILNGTLSLKAEGWTDVRKLLKKVQFICRLHELEWVDVVHNNFSIMVEHDSEIEELATEYEQWKKERL